MLKTADFFETQIKQRRDSAARSSKKNNREFWLKMANLWEGLLQARRPGEIATADPRQGRGSAWRIHSKALGRN